MNPVTLNEIRTGLVDYVEIWGPPGWPLLGITYIVLSGSGQLSYALTLTVSELTPGCERL